MPFLVTTAADLHAAGVTRAQVNAQLRARRWQRWGHAIVLHNGPLSREQRWQVARVHGGPQAVLTAFTAAQSFGLRSWDRRETHLLLPRGARVVHGSPVPLRIHRVRDWERVRHHDTFRHCCADALLVASANLPSTRSACGVLTSAVQQRIVTPEALRDALSRSLRVKRRRLLMMTVADIEQGADALSEIDFVRLCRRYGLPKPRQQQVRQDPSGRRRYLDATWTRFDGRLVVVEIDGAVHLDQGRWWDDQLRQNDIVLDDDAIVLRYPSAVVRAEPAFVAGQLRRALGIGHASGLPRAARSMTKR